MNSNPNFYPSTSKGEFPEPPSKPNRPSSYELHPSLKAMVWAQPFTGLENENPCHHLHEFEEMCSGLSILGMTQETLRWKLFPFSLKGKAKQWYTHAIESTNGATMNIEIIFVLHFFPCPVSSLYQGRSSISSKMRSL